MTRLTANSTESLFLLNASNLYRSQVSKLVPVGYMPKLFFNRIYTSNGKGVTLAWVER
jgi:hypothetical protein